MLRSSHKYIPEIPMAGILPTFSDIFFKKNSILNPNSVKYALKGLIDNKLG